MSTPDTLKHGGWLSIARKHGYAFPDARMETFVGELLTLARTAVVSEGQAIPTDLSKRLRAAIAVNGVIDRVTTLAAADEIDRYYGGMLAWKEAAEEKDSYISELKAAYE